MHLDEPKAIEIVHSPILMLLAERKFAPKGQLFL
jgi:hypothetical protein